jgi:uncharacterized membrane protein YfcA
MIIIFLCSYLAFSLSALCGGGAGLMLMPVLGRLLPVSQIPVALSIGTFTSSASRLTVFYRSINWHIVKYFMPAALPAVAIGAFLLKYVNPLYLEIAMALFLISNLPMVIRRKKPENANRPPSNKYLTIIGFLAGFLSGFTGAVGLLFNKFYLRYGLTKEQIIATRAANEIILHLIKIVLYIFFGLVTVHALSIGLTVAVSGLLSTFTTKWLLPRLSEDLFKRIGYAAMVLSGLALLGQSGRTAMTNNNATFAYEPLSKGIEAKLKWQQSGYSLEFALDDGFEFEQVVPMSELSAKQRDLVLSGKGDADQIVIEAVYTFAPLSYEAYYFRNGHLLKKFDFDQNGSVSGQESNG